MIEALLGLFSYRLFFLYLQSCLLSGGRSKRSVNLVTNDTDIQSITIKLDITSKQPEGNYIL